MNALWILPAGSLAVAATVAAAGAHRLRAHTAGLTADAAAMAELRASARALGDDVAAVRHHLGRTGAAAETRRGER